MRGCSSQDMMSLCRPGWPHNSLCRSGWPCTHRILLLCPPLPPPHFPAPFLFLSFLPFWIPIPGLALLEYYLCIWNINIFHLENILLGATSWLGSQSRNLRRWAKPVLGGYRSITFGFVGVELQANPGALIWSCNSSDKILRAKSAEFSSLSVSHTGRQMCPGPAESRTPAIIWSSLCLLRLAWIGCRDPAKATGLCNQTQRNPACECKARRPQARLERWEGSLSAAGRETTGFFLKWHPCGTKMHEVYMYISQHAPLSPFLGTLN